MYFVTYDGHNRNYHKKLNNDDIINLRDQQVNMLGCEWARVVILPKEIKLSCYIVGKKYSLHDAKTINKFKMNIRIGYIKLLSSRGKISYIRSILTSRVKIINLPPGIDIF
jgi:hypothetical protein